MESFNNSASRYSLWVTVTLYIYDKEKKEFSPSQETTFKSHNILERKDLEKWITDHPEILGEEFLIVTTEYDQFDKTKERLDLLAVDRKGKLTIIELKRDESGKNVELQALKYAAYCSTLSIEEIVEIRNQYLQKIGKRVDKEETEKELLNFIDNPDFEQFDDKPRIILVAREFRPEVTASVMWLRKFGLDISCVKFTLYHIDKDRVGLVSSILIPIPEAEEYIIKSERKSDPGRTLTRTQEEYQDFFTDLSNKFSERVPISMGEVKPRSYYQIPVGASWVHFEWTFHGRPRDSLGVELHFENSNREKNLSIFDELMKSKTEIESKFDQPVSFERDFTKRWARICIIKNSGVITDELKSWAVETMVQFYNVLHPKLEKIQSQL